MTATHRRRRRARPGRPRTRSPPLVDAGGALHVAGADHHRHHDPQRGDPDAVAGRSTRRPGELQWIVDAYTVVFAGLLLTCGSLGDRFGRRRSARPRPGRCSASAALASALVDTATALIAMRAVTGVGAALIFPATLSIITNVFTEPVERQRAIADLGQHGGHRHRARAARRRHAARALLLGLDLPGEHPGVRCSPSPASRWSCPESRDPVHAPPRPARRPALDRRPRRTRLRRDPGRQRRLGSTAARSLGAGGRHRADRALRPSTRRAPPEPMLDVRVFRNPRFSAAPASPCRRRLLLPVRHDLPLDPAHAGAAGLRRAGRGHPHRAVRRRAHRRGQPDAADRGPLRAPAPDRRRAAGRRGVAAAAHRVDARHRLRPDRAREPDACSPPAWAC